MKIRAVIIDDEPLARKRLARLLREHPQVEIIGEAGDGREGLAVVARTHPDVVFLDIRMPQLTGFEMLGKLVQSPFVIFTTAYDEHALRAFEENTIDYLLKPIPREALARAIEKAERILQSGGSTAAELARLRATLERTDEVLRRFSIASGRQIVLIQDQEVDYFHAEDKYTLLHRGERSHIVPFTIKQLERRLDRDTFARVHRSYIVNLNRVASVERWFGGRLMITLAGGTEIPVSRGYAAEFRRRINL